LKKNRLSFPGRTVVSIKNRWKYLQKCGISQNHKSEVHIFDLEARNHNNNKDVDSDSFPFDDEDLFYLFSE
jgi:hypothetical protein